MNPTSPSGIALKRFLETTGIVLVAALLVTLPTLQAQLTVCANAANVTGAAVVASCQIGWGAILSSFAAAIIAGGINALTAFLSSLHNLVVGPTVTTTTPLTSTGPVGPSVTSIETKGVRLT